jgi:hypothetical protein
VVSVKRRVVRETDDLVSETNGLVSVKSHGVRATDEVFGESDDVGQRVRRWARRDHRVGQGDR